MSIGEAMKDVLSRFEADGAVRPFHVVFVSLDGAMRYERYNAADSDGEMLAKSGGVPDLPIFVMIVPARGGQVKHVTLARGGVIQ